MNKDVQVFDFNGLPLSITVDKEGSPWFVAGEVCKALAITDTSQACKRLDDDEKLVRTLYVAGQSREILTINESGLYSLVLTSNKPSAKEFKKWVTSEVLPSIRKTGGYNLKDKDLFLKNEKNNRAIFKMHLNDFSNFYPKKEAIIKASEKTKQETGFDLMTACGVTVDTDTVNLEHDAIMRIFGDERKRTERQVIMSRSGVKPFSELKKGKSKVIRKTLNELCNNGFLSKCGDTFSIPAN